MRYDIKYKLSLVKFDRSDQNIHASFSLIVRGVSLPYPLTASLFGERILVEVRIGEAGGLRFVLTRDWIARRSGVDLSIG